MQNLIRIRDAAKILGISQTTLWRLHESDPKFPRKIRLTRGIVGFLASDIEDYLDYQRSVAVGGAK